MELLEHLTSSKMALISRERSGMKGLALATKFQWDSRVVGVQGIT